jgi:hypothetical protein
VNVHAFTPSVRVRSSIRTCIVVDVGASAYGSAYIFCLACRAGMPAFYVLDLYVYYCDVLDTHDIRDILDITRYSIVYYT